MSMPRWKRLVSLVGLAAISAGAALRSQSCLPRSSRTSRTFAGPVI
jgi:hypothetical protein